MHQQIITDYPPIISALEAEFGRAKLRNPKRPVLFAYGGVIYNPQGITVPPPLLAHEHVHGERQLRWGLDQWWEDYISSTYFRLKEEIPAHIAEARVMYSPNPCRRNKMAIVSVISKKLASPLYGGLISRMKARAIIKEALK